MIANMMNIKKIIFATPAATAKTPVNPIMAAMMILRFSGMASLQLPHPVHQQLAPQQHFHQLAYRLLTPHQQAMVVQQLKPTQQLQLLVQSLVVFFNLAQAQSQLPA